MPNTSATGGYLLATSPASLNDDALCDFLHDVIAGTTGLANSSVRPAFQKNAPTRPNANANWVGFRIDNQTPEAGNSFVEELSSGAGATQQRHETFELVCTFYGPSCRGYAQAMRDNLEVAQNRELLFLAKMAYVDCGPIRQNAELVHEEWYNRADVTFRFRRQLDVDYAILSFARATGTINTETMTIPWAAGPEV